MATKTKIEFNLFDLNSIENAIGELNLYKRKFDAKVDLFIRRLAEYGVEVAKEKVQKFDAVFTAELLNSLHVENRDSCFFIVSDSEHTAFVEFGTGQYGQENPYKYPLPSGVNWAYNTGEHIQYAEETLVWGDRVISQGTYYWFYFDTRTSRWMLTQGMRSRPFMYETAMELSKVSTIRKIAKEVFSDAQ